MDRLAPWNPEAGFFHMATRDVVFSSPQKVASHRRLARVRQSRPPTLKRYPGAERIDLPRPETAGEFPASPEGAEDVAAVFVVARAFG